MKKYDLHKIMKAAHEIYRKYFKLYQLTPVYRLSVIA